MDTEYHFALVGSQVFDDPPCRRNGGPRRAANCRGASIRPCSSCDVFSRWMTSARCAEWSPWSPRTSVGATSSRSGQGRFLAGRCRLCRACRGSDGADRNRGPRASAPCRRVLRVAPTGDDAGPHPRRFVGTPADGLAVSRLVTEAASEVFPSIVREVGQARIDLGRNLSDAQGGRDHRRRGRPISPHAEPSTSRRAHGSHLCVEGCRRREPNSPSSRMGRGRRPRRRSKAQPSRGRSPSGSAPSAGMITREAEPPRQPAPSIARGGGRRQTFTARNAGTRMMSSARWSTRGGATEAGEPRISTSGPA